VPTANGQRCGCCKTPTNLGKQVLIQCYPKDGGVPHRLFAFYLPEKQTEENIKSFQIE
jgi:hypothetical protein